MTKEKPSVVRQSWEAFVKDYDLVMKFGVDALEEKINAQASGQRQSPYSKQQVNDMLTNIENSRELEEMINASFDKVYQMLALMQTPRATSPQPQADMEAQAGRKYEQAPWAAKFDIAADANYRNIQNVINDLNTNYDPNAPKDALLNQYKHKLKMDMRQRLENKLALQNKLDYKPSVKPKKPGEF